MSGIIAQNTLLSSGLIKSPAGGGAWNFISKSTASSSATIDVTSGIDSTYKVYLFTWNSIHPGNNSVYFSFQGNAAGESGYNETITSSTFRAYHNEADDDTDLEYYTGNDQAEGTAFQRLGITINNSNDNSSSGTLYLYNPSSTTFVKHFMATAQEIIDDSYSMQQFTSGYFNTTGAIDAIQFKMSAGNIDAGDICLYGLTT